MNFYELQICVYYLSQHDSNQSLQIVELLVSLFVNLHKITKLRQAMQNNEKESQSGLKLLAILLFIFALGLLTFIDDKSDIEMNLDNPKTVVILKLLQAVSV